MDHNPGIGHNNPPLTPYESVKGKIEDLYAEAKLWLDGEPVETQDQADGLETLGDMLKSAIKEADTARKEEAKPHDEAKAEIQSRYNLLIGDTKAVTGLAVKALEVVKAALTPYKIKVQKEKEESARKAREEADRIADEALAKHNAVDTSNLEDKEAADDLLRQAEAARRAANKADKSATVKTGLRTTYDAEVISYPTLLMHVKANAPDDLRLFLDEWAQRKVKSFGLNAGGMVIPGVKIHEIKEAR